MLERLRHLSRRVRPLRSPRPAAVAALGVTAVLLAPAAATAATRPLAHIGPIAYAAGTANRGPVAYAAGTARRGPVAYAAGSPRVKPRTRPASARTSVTLPPQGLYEECAPSDQAQCAGELSLMGGAGFRLAVNYTAWYGSAAQIQAYAAEAQSAGVKIIWPLNYAAWRDAGTASTLPSEYSDLAPDCGCATNAAFLQYAITLVRSLPATWGYYIGDELDPSQAPEVAALAAAVRALDPGHPLLYVGQGGPQTTFDLRPFESAAGTVGADVYPVGQDVPTSYVGGVASTVQRLSAAAHTHPAMVLQAFSWGEYPTELQAPDPRWPTSNEMRQMRDQALPAKPSMILWYSLEDINASPDPQAHWHDLVSAAFAAASVKRTPRTARDRRLRAAWPAAHHPATLPGREGRTRGR
jgi:hypothetical protein